MRHALAYNHYNRHEGLVYMAWALGLPVSRSNKKAVLLNAIHQTVVERLHAKIMADIAHISDHSAGAHGAPSAAAGAHGAPPDGASAATDAATDLAVLNDILGISGETQTDSDTDGDWDKYEAGQVIEFFLRVDGEEKLLSASMDPSDQMRDVKDLLVNKLGFKVSVDSLRLTYGGKPLTKDSATIDDYGIQPYSTVDVRLKEAFLLGAGKRASSRNPFADDEVATVMAVDGPLFQRAFDSALELIKDTTDVVAKLDGMTASDLKSAIEQILHGKQHINVKVQTVVKAIPGMVAMSLASKKLDGSFSIITTNLSKKLWDHVCGETMDGKFSVDVFVRMLGEIVKKKGGDTMET